MTANRTAGVTSNTHTTASLTTGSSLVLAGNSAAAYRLFQNKTGATVSLGCGVDAVDGQGIVLETGQNYEMTRQAGNLDSRNIYGGIHTGTGTLVITEGA